MNPNTPTKVCVVVKSGCVESVLANDDRLEIEVIDLDNRDEQADDDRLRVEGLRLNPAFRELWP